MAETGAPAPGAAAPVDECVRAKVDGHPQNGQVVRVEHSCGSPRTITGPPHKWPQCLIQRRGAAHGAKGYRARSPEPATARKAAPCGSPPRLPRRPLQLAQVAMQSGDRGGGGCAQACAPRGKKKTERSKGSTVSQQPRSVQTLKRVGVGPDEGSQRNLVARRPRRRALESGACGPMRSDHAAGQQPASD